MSGIVPHDNADDVIVSILDVVQITQKGVFANRSEFGPRVSEAKEITSTGENAIIM